jgi:WD40 repeat protein
MSSSLGTLHRLTQERALDGHHGCVNTVHFNPTGELLLSGSDDLRIILWDWSSGKGSPQAYKQTCTRPYLEQIGSLDLTGDSNLQGRQFGG